MSISAISPINVKGINFTASDNKEYENPINRKTERNLSIWTSLGASALVGGTAYGLTSCVTKKGWKIPAAIGGTAAAAWLLLTLPSRLYNTNVNAFTREKEMDVFSRQKEAQANIYSDINNEIKDEDVPLSEKISHYATVKMADNGKGLMVKDA
jgi:hypothetical protein